MLHAEGVVVVAWFLFLIILSAAAEAIHFPSWACIVAGAAMTVVASGVLANCNFQGLVKCG